MNDQHTRCLRVGYVNVATRVVVYHSETLLAQLQKNNNKYKKTKKFLSSFTNCLWCNNNRGKCATLFLLHQVTSHTTLQRTIFSKRKQKKKNRFYVGIVQGEQWDKITFLFLLFSLPPFFLVEMQARRIRWDYRGKSPRSTVIISPLGTYTVIIIIACVCNALYKYCSTCTKNC